MFAKARRRKLIGISCLTVLLVSVGAGFITLKWWDAKYGCYNNRPPLHSFVLTVDRSQQHQVITQSQLFSERNGFGFGIAYYTPDHQQFLIDLTRKDTEIIGANNPFNPDSYFVTFHNNNCSKPTTAAELVGLVTELKQYYLQVPGAQISEER